MHASKQIAHNSDTYTVKYTSKTDTCGRYLCTYHLCVCVHVRDHCFTSAMHTSMHTCATAYGQDVKERNRSIARYLCEKTQKQTYVRTKTLFVCLIYTQLNTVSDICSLSFCAYDKQHQEACVHIFPTAFRHIHSEIHSENRHLQTLPMYVPPMCLWARSRPLYHFRDTYEYAHVHDSLRATRHKRKQVDRDIPV